jgi:hypothetical protein
MKVRPTWLQKSMLNTQPKDREWKIGVGACHGKNYIHLELMVAVLV